MVEPALGRPVQPALAPLVELAVELPVDLPVVPFGLTRYTLCLTCVALPCLGRFLRVAPVPSPPGTSRTQVISPLAQSATAMHISTRLLF
ncbi:hypothetical protein EASAB2608_04027 [Streptomyces sp. EAS-AB2608]|uniref:Uncharacterized protein n=1 Tax=Streptomyces bangladeshensis TaxID=295352 RepID=A0ABN3BUW3_9ACTN|nr:hypothetical protein EASAB2608_04027 [Streptomyces sp. EAS-AB2608]